jgi:ribosomal protein S18 acetylase RimI-like enzyme
VHIERARPEHLASLAELAARSQSDPGRHIAYAGEDPATIAAEVRDAEDWVGSTWIAVHGDRLTGWLLGDVDRQMGRVWWWGPFVDPAEIWGEAADLLYRAAAPVLAFAQEEMVSDTRSALLPAFAERHGFHPEEGSVLLTCRRPPAKAEGEPPVSVAGSDHGGQVAALHDALFPGTHTGGARLVSLGGDRRTLLVSLAGSRVVGYVATELQHDGSLYLDYLGVAPADRRRGIGRALVAEAVRRGMARGAGRAHLSVRESNAGARGLYRSLGFDEDRVVRPYRKGFSLT